MDIRSVGAGLPGVGTPGIGPAIPVAKALQAPATVPAAAGTDSVGALLASLSEERVASLLNIIEPATDPRKTAQVDQLLRTAVVAAGDGDVVTALARLSALVTLDPRRAEVLADEPVLAPIRKEVATLLVRLAATARLGAETRLQEATEWLQSPGAVQRLVENADAPTLLLLARQLMEAGGYANWAHSAEVSQLVLDRRPATDSGVPPLLRAAIAAVEQGKPAEALEKLAALVPLEPRLAETLAEHPALAPIRKEVAAMLAELTGAVRLDAETRLRQVTARLDEKVKTSTLRALAAALPETGDAAVRQFAAAVERGEVKEALASLATLLARDPELAETIVSHPALAHLREEVEPLLAELAATPRPSRLTASKLLEVATHLFKTGGLANWVRSAEVSEILLEGSEPLPPPPPAEIEELVRTAVSAARRGDYPEALAKLETLAVPDPRRAEALAVDPIFAPVREEVEALITRLEGTARQEAETRLHEAVQRFGTPAEAERPLENVTPRTLLMLAAQLIETGGYSNCLHAAALLQLAIEQPRWAPAEIQSPLFRRKTARRAKSRPEKTARFRNLWRRAPLLVLLLAWLAVGLTVGSATILFAERWTSAQVELFFEIWALGFLALIGFQFYMRVRRL